MGEQRISMESGFADQLALIRNTETQYPRVDEMQAVTGPGNGLGQHIANDLAAGAGRMHSVIMDLDRDLQALERTAAAAVADQQETEATIADELRATLARFEAGVDDAGVTGGADGTGPAAARQSRGVPGAE
ncbi:hypothetical protein [Leucobacter chromiiresistens]|uniref:Excreted virulence factor EspC, type VII ESX diderm n=1 Tax=Leucobacter chromiiresistens TaxID=1079994 RepID=A0A1H0YA12_9MICO|nr:hypothetical protein [Leucobacter chromiiresistens]SDQ12007.1 hypothetical protein SAMN04488565_0673 [Leucobacter chromiiresistens]